MNTSSQKPCVKDMNSSVGNTSGIEVKFSLYLFFSTIRDLVVKKDKLCFYYHVRFLFILLLRNHKKQVFELRKRFYSIVLTCMFILRGVSFSKFDLFCVPQKHVLTKLKIRTTKDCSCGNGPQTSDHVMQNWLSFMAFREQPTP